jgi:hypothetical protein
MRNWQPYLRLSRLGHIHLVHVIPHGSGRLGILPYLVKQALAARLTWRQRLSPLHLAGETPGYVRLCLWADLLSAALPRESSSSLSPNPTLL